MEILPENFMATLATIACKAPDLVSMWKAPPENRITSKRSMLSIKAFTMYMGIDSGLTGVLGT